MKAVGIVLAPIWIFLFIYFVGSRPASPYITPIPSAAPDSLLLPPPQLRGRAPQPKQTPPTTPLLRTQRYFHNLKLYGSFRLRGKLFTDFTTPPPPPRSGCTYTGRDALYNSRDAKSRRREGMKDGGRTPASKNHVLRYFSRIDKRSGRVSRGIR